MAKSTGAAARPRAASMHWEQAVLPLGTLEPGPVSDLAPPVAPMHGMHEALDAADRAQDRLTQRGALARMYVELVERAIARGRKPAPKPKG